VIYNWSVFLFSFELQDYSERGVDRFRQVEDDVNYDNVQMDMSEVSTYLNLTGFGWEGLKDFKHSVMTPTAY
jgi:hypothetical protein